MTELRSIFNNLIETMSSYDCEKYEKELAALSAEIGAIEYVLSFRHGASNED